MEFGVKAPILYPLGRPESSDLATVCTSLEILAGGDPTRAFDGPKPLDIFCRHIKRTPFFQEWIGRLLVIMVCDSPWQAVETRERVEAALPYLIVTSNGLWVVATERQALRRFESEASRYGQLTGNAPQGMIWNVGSRALLVVTPDTADKAGLKINLERFIKKSNTSPPSLASR